MTEITLPGRLVTALLFFVLPILAYTWQITGGSFDVFGPSYGWQAYNYLALSLAEGRQSVPAEVISAEGNYVGGHVYMYYGLLPAIIRLPLIPFVDLRVVPVSNFLILAMLAVGQWSLQLAILRIFVANGRTRMWADRVIMVLVSLTVWFASGAMLIAIDGNFYKEPYAAALMLTSVVIAMLLQDLLVEGVRPKGKRLMAYAALAGLAVFTRQTAAVGLYIIVLALLLPAWSDLRARSQTLLASLRNALLPLSVLFAAGAAYLAAVYLRTGHFGTGWSIESYGYYILGTDRPRLEVLMRQQFSAVRIVPNLIYLLDADATRREQLIYAWGGGIVRTHGHGVKWSFFAVLPLAFAAAGLACIWRRYRDDQAVAPLLFATLGFAVPALAILAYPTMNYRYTPEIWPLVCWLMLIAYRDIDPASWFGRFTVPALVVMAGMCLLSLDYIRMRRHILINNRPLGLDSLLVGVPLPHELAALATAPDARAPEVIPNRAANRDNPNMRFYPSGPSN